VGTATNCILWGNSPNDVFELPNAAYQTSVSYSCLSTAYDGTGNIVGNPDFVNPSAGDFRLRSTSPCINTGTSDGAPAADILGRSRPQGAVLDMGAYEHIPQDDNDAVEPPVLLRVDCASAAVNPDGLSWATAYPTLQAAADKTGYGGEIWVAKGIYTSASGDNVVRLNTGTVMLGGFAGTESDRDQRNWKTNPTVIDGEGERRCVTSNSGCFIDGFTLQNGKAESGGGMSSGTAANCTFTGNTAVYGGGMYEGMAIHCSFSDNTATTGGGMYEGTATNCSFTGNKAEGGGGGGMCDGTATNCTFTGNRASSGGGMLDGTATNCILWGNYPNDADETSVSYSCLSTAYDGSGNIVGDPDFVNPSAGDYSLRSTSPCIDVGTSDGEDIPSTDIDGVPRPQEAGIDMGAYEYYSPVSVPDVAGKVLADAKSSIKDAGLVVGEVDGQHNNMVTAGSVIIQDPAAGAGVYRGRPVDLIISLGPELF
ncbi:MAG: PASTA domain-containing protein, partial [Candidatus Hydrogenedentes bacterium]|nr:PASTA domain-containing protein [Candidatus Hydrogenedentota bacterium]